MKKKNPQGERFQLHGFFFFLSLLSCCREISLMCMAFLWDTEDSEAGQVAGLHNSHHLWEQTTLCITYTQSRP